MATTKMTFTLPEDVARSFVRRVGPSRRSKYVAEAIAARLRERDIAFEAACNALEGDPDLAMLDREMDALNDDPIGEAQYAPEAR
jgi:hypothetical protein